MIATLLLSACALAQSPHVQTPSQEMVTAFETAKNENRRVLVIQTLADENANAEVKQLFKNRAVSRKVLYEYAKLSLDWEPEGGNTDLLQIFPAEGAMLASMSLKELRLESGKLDGEKLLSFLTEHEAEPWDAMDILETARLKAIKENKNLFIDLSAPW
ncbi:MAG: hypothetical protein GY747_10990 [Planctomycetes bacterium]|nr:hypothetical protein [Planctomycetota bacterium]MCP4772155.1 hypothetical protein [Planctomycetota bacterium]MCP4861384.1 hypothetical protein [Planctomycetota bacterium]